VTAQYDAAGRRASTTAGGITRGFGYDNAGRMTNNTVTGQRGTGQVAQRAVAVAGGAG
jgi:YD repeat-containing protein